MHEGTIIWMILFAAFALLFFGIAAVVSVRGISDIKDLLSETEEENSHE
ncbi:MAG: hypothetical protein AAFW89_00425 [Bacteroidota bacterium]